MVREEIFHLGAHTARLRLGDYREMLADVTADAAIFDPPYGRGTHVGHNRMAHLHESTRQKLDYSHWNEANVTECVQFLAPRISGWIFAMTSDDLATPWRLAYREAKRLDFTPVWIVQNSVRLVGDGPASPGVYGTRSCKLPRFTHPRHTVRDPKPRQALPFGVHPGYGMAARPRNRSFATWGSLPGHYMAARGIVPPGLKAAYTGGKSIELLRKIVGDYSRPGDCVMDPTFGAGTTAAACLLTGRDFVGSEIDPEAFDLACQVLRAVTSQQTLSLLG